MKTMLPVVFIALLQFIFIKGSAQTFPKGELLYSNTLAGKEDTAGWRMEGSGKVEFAKGWMKMFSPHEKGHHVFWCPQLFPENFIAEWEVQNLQTKAGLCIVFFSATGLNGEDIFDSSLPKRNGTFKEYTKGAINNYHISYYSNSKDHPKRETAHLRKNQGFHLVQSKEPGIPIHSKAIHKIQLIKFEGRMLLYIDSRKVIDWQDDGKQFGKILQEGKIGFRQMKWTQFTYRNFYVWEHKPVEDSKH